MVIRRCLFCEQKDIKGKKKGHKELVNCSCGAIYKVLWAGDIVFSVSAIHDSEHYYNLSNKMLDNKMTLLLDTDKIIKYN